LVEQNIVVRLRWPISNLIKGQVYLVDLKKKRCEIEDKDGILYNCFIQESNNLLSKNVYFKIDDKPDDIEKQNVTTKERIDDILKYEKETETNIEN